MAEIVQFPRRDERQEAEPTASRRGAALPTESWAVLVPFGAESSIPFAPLSSACEELDPPDKTAG